jgi:hypothetical protein
MKTINPIERLTIRKGKLVVQPLYKENIPAREWDWYDCAFGLGWRSYAGLIDGQFHEIGITFDNYYKVIEAKNPKKINVSFNPNKFSETQKYGYRICYGYYWIDLKNVYRLMFEDKLTKKRFFVGNYGSLDFFQPTIEDGVECKAHWGFNPYAINGTGFKSWTDPKYVDIITNGFKTERSKTDIFEAMEHAEGHKNEHMKDLIDYTGINF